MKERPILFNAPMVCAIVEGRKTQTRRLLTPQPHTVEPGQSRWMVGKLGWLSHEPVQDFIDACPYGQPGDQLWVREAWSTHACFDAVPPAKLTTRSIHYLADGKIGTGKGRPSIHMPRWACRILLEITAVRVERLNDIRRDDAVAEGVERNGFGFKAEGENRPRGAYEAYRALWESINGAGSWERNPWVWVVEFKSVEGCVL